MSGSFVKLFNTITDSSIWALPDHVRIVWITMLAMADRDGNVHASIVGVAGRARKSLEETQDALRIFMAPDPYSRTKVAEGRRLEEIEGGWHFITWEIHRRALEEEGTRERKRTWWRDNRGTAKASSDPQPLDALDTKPSRRDDGSRSLSGSDLDPDPEGGRGGTVEAQGQRLVFRDLGDWQPPDDLIAEALERGLTRAEFDARIDNLRQGPIGGARGVYDRTQYVRSQLGRWRTWSETERAKANSGAAKGPRSAFGGGRDQRSGPVLEASEKHRRYAAKYGLDLDEVMSYLDRTCAVDKVGLARAREMIGELLTQRAREKARGAA